MAVLYTLTMSKWIIQIILKFNKHSFTVILDMKEHLLKLKIINNVTTTVLLNIVYFKIIWQINLVC